MLPFGVTILATVLQRSEIPEGLINYPVYTEITTSLVVRHVLNLQGPDRQPGRIRCAFFSKCRDSNTAENIGSYQCCLLRIVASFVSADETGSYVTTAEHA